MNYIKSATIPLTKTITTPTTTTTNQKLDEFSKLDYFNYKLGIDIGPLPLQFEYLTKFKENDESRIHLIKTIGHFQSLFEKSLSSKNKNTIKDDAFRIYKMHTFLAELEKISIEYIDNLIKFSENKTIQTDLPLSSFNLTKYTNEQSYNRMRDNMSYYIGKRNNQLWELKNSIENKKWKDIKEQYHLIARSVYIIYEYETKIRPLLF
jgi:hypothetical protein